MTALKRIAYCEVCDNADLIPVLNLGEQPLCDDLVPVGNPATPPVYPIELGACPICLTVHQFYQVPKRTLFPQSYHYRAAMTQDVVAGMRNLVELANRYAGDLAGKVVLDIGCNDGSLLEIFKSKNAKTIGIEPTSAAQDALARCDHVINDFFDTSSVDTYLSLYPKPDIITFTNVFAHIEDLNAVLANLRAVAKDTTAIVIENHYLGAVLAKNQFDTFYHEHPRTYSFKSFQWIAKKLGMNISHVEFPQRYNGNIRVILSKDGASTDVAPEESTFISGFSLMNTYIDDYKKRLRQTLADLVRAHGPLPAKAFPGRAAILIHYFGVDEHTLFATYERSGSPKIGNYIPGTRIEIRDEREFFSQASQPVILNLAWHIKDEIHAYMRSKGFEGKIVEIFS